MVTPDHVQPKKTVRTIPATLDMQKEIEQATRLLRVAAYCRVSTKQEEQLNSYENQYKFYTDKINSEPGWTMAGIFADKGITGTSVKKRDEFNRLIQKCKRGKVDMIITKSIARFARNTLDCLKYTRMLKELGVDVFFEEQGIHSTQPGAEFYITIYGSIAQSESENISANVRWGKEQSAREGKSLNIFFVPDRQKKTSVRMPFLFGIGIPEGKFEATESSSSVEGDRISVEKFAVRSSVLTVLYEVNC